MLKEHMLSVVVFLAFIYLNGRDRDLSPAGSLRTAGTELAGRGNQKPRTHPVSAVPGIPDLGEPFPVTPCAHCRQAGARSTALTCPPGVIVDVSLPCHVLAIRPKSNKTK